LVAIEGVMVGDVVVRGEQEPARSARGICDGHAGLRLHHVDHRLDQGARREVLTGA